MIDSSIFDTVFFNPERYRGDGAKTIHGDCWFYTEFCNILKIKGVSHQNECVKVPPTINRKQVLDINTSAFKYDERLKGVELSHGIENIKSKAFYGCKNLLYVKIPASVVDIAPDAFLSCCGIERFDVDIYNQRYKSDAGMLLTKDGTTLIQGIKGNVIVPNGVERINARAFQDGKGLRSVTIPSSVKYVGDFAFSGCCNLTNIVFPCNVKRIGDYAFSSCSELTVATIPDLKNCEVGKGIYHGCYNLREIRFPRSCIENQNEIILQCIGECSPNLEISYYNATSINRNQTPSVTIDW